MSIRNVVVFSKNKDFVLSNFKALMSTRANFLREKYLQYRVNFLELKMSAPSNPVSHLDV